MGLIMLQVPAEAKYAGVVRAAVARVGAENGLSIERIEDLRLAASEAFVSLIHDEGGEITITIDDSERGVVTFHLEGSRPHPTDPERLLAWQLAVALADEAHREGATARLKIRDESTAAP